MSSVISSLLALFALLPSFNRNSSSLLDRFDPKITYDFVIVGAGSSGTNGHCQYPRGKTLGGSSSINAMLYTRGYAYDYNKWELNGAHGWGYNDNEMYFNRVENMMPVEGFKYKTPLSDEYIRAGAMSGLQNVQCNNTESDCIYETQNTVRNSFRFSAYKAYLANYRSNRLAIMDNALVTKLIIRDNIAEGVEFERDGQIYVVRPLNEVILSAGAINTPQILMLSGIGPRKHLMEHNIDVARDLPVGENLQDHTRVTILYTLNSTYPTTSRDIMAPDSLRLFTKHQGGPMSSTGIETMGFFKTDKTSSEPPDVQLVFSSFVPMPGSNPVIGVAVSPGRPKSVGYVKLQNTDAKNPPLINPQYFTQANDYDVMLKGIRKAHEILNTPVMDKYNPQFFPRAFCLNLTTEDFFQCLAKYHSLTNYHPVGTARMGDPSHKTSVVDPQLRVIGIKRLRVVDASVAPTIPSTNINAMALMIGEKASDIINNEYNIRFISGTIQMALKQLTRLIQLI